MGLLSQLSKFQIIFLYRLKCQNHACVCEVLITCTHYAEYNEIYSHEEFDEQHQNVFSTQDTSIKGIVFNYTWLASLADYVHSRRTNQFVLLKLGCSLH